MKNTKLLSLFASFATLACTQTLYEVDHVTNSNLPAGEGIVYTLPKLELAVEIDVKRTTVTYGKWACLNPQLGLAKIDKHDERCRDAQRALEEAKKQAEADKKTNKSTDKPEPLAVTITKPKPQPEDDKYEIGDVRVTDRIVADANQRYRIDVEKWQERGRDRSLEFVMTEDGRLSSAGATITDRRPEMAAAGVRAVVNVVGKVIGVAAKTMTGGAPLAADEKFNPDEPETTCAPGIDLDACAAAARLHKLFAIRTAILKDSVGSKVDVRVAAIDKEIADLSKNFSSNEKITVTTSRDFVEPTTKDWYFDAKGTPLQTANGSSTTVTLKLTPASGGSNNAVSDGSEGIVYRVPVEARITVAVSTQGNNGKVEKIVVDRKTLVPQFGAVQTLPHQLRGRKTKLAVELSASTGMLTRLELSTEANYSDVIDTIGDSGARTVEAAGTLVENPELRDISDKKRLLEELELDRQIGCYEELGTACPAPEGAE